MIGRLLTALELEIVFLHSDRLRSLGFAANSGACLVDEVYNAFGPDWQALVLADMQFTLDAERDALALQAKDVTP